MRILFLGYQDSRLIHLLRGKSHSVIGETSPVDNLSEWPLTISFGYRHILPPKVLRTSPRSPVNLHISYLPWNRGAHPNFWSWAEATPSGVSIHEIDAGIDTGPIIAQEHFEGPATTFRETYAALISQVEALFEGHMDRIISGDYVAQPQPSAGSYHNARDLPEWVDWDMMISEAVQRFHS